MNQAEEEHIEVYERLDEENGSCFMAEEPSWRGIAEELEELRVSRRQISFSNRRAKSISIDRFVANHPSFYRLLKKRYEK